MVQKNTYILSCISSPNTVLCFTSECSSSHAYYISFRVFVTYSSSVDQLVRKVVAPINNSAGLALIIANLRSHRAELATRL